MDCHLVAVEVCVECGTYQRMQLYSFSVYQYRVKRLNREFVERRCAVKHYRILVDNLLKALPHFVCTLFYKIFCSLESRCITLLFKLRKKMRFEKFKCHVFRKAALVHAQIRPYDDNGTSGKVDTFTQKVLPESPLLTLDNFTQRLQRPLVGTFHRISAASVVKERIDRLLKHTLLVSDNDLRRIELHKTLQALVPVDYTTVEVVYIRNSEFAAVESDKRPQIRRKNRKHIEHHPLRSVVGCKECLDHFQSFDKRFSFRFGTCLLNLRFEGMKQLCKIQVCQKTFDNFASHLCMEAAVCKTLINGLELLFIQNIVLENGGLAFVVIARFTGILYDIRLIIEYPLQIFHLYAKQCTDS